MAISEELISTFLFKENNFEPPKKQLRTALAKYTFFQEPGKSVYIPAYEELLEQLCRIERDCFEMKEYDLSDLYAAFLWWRYRNPGKTMMGKPDSFKKMVAAFILQHVLENEKKWLYSGCFSCGSLARSMEKYMEEIDPGKKEIDPEEEDWGYWHERYWYNADNYQQVLDMTKYVVDNYQQALDTAKEFEGQHFGDIFAYITGAKYMSLTKGVHPVMDDLIRKGLLQGLE